MKTSVSESRFSLRRSCFPVNFAKFVRTAFVYNVSGRPFLEPIVLRANRKHFQVNFRGSCLEVFHEKRVPNNFAEFAEK